MYDFVKSVFIKDDKYHSHKHYDAHENQWIGKSLPDFGTCVAAVLMKWSIYSEKSFRSSTMMLRAAHINIVSMREQNSQVHSLGRVEIDWANSGHHNQHTQRDRDEEFDHMCRAIL